MTSAPPASASSASAAAQREAEQREQAAQLERRLAQERAEKEALARQREAQERESARIAREVARPAPQVTPAAPKAVAPPAASPAPFAPFASAAPSFVMVNGMLVPSFALQAQGPAQPPPVAKATPAPAAPLASSPFIVSATPAYTPTPATPAYTPAPATPAYTPAPVTPTYTPAPAHTPAPPVQVRPAAPPPQGRSLSSADRSFYGKGNDRGHESELSLFLKPDGTFQFNTGHKLNDAGKRGRTEWKGVFIETESAVELVVLQKQYNVTIRVPGAFGARPPPIAGESEPLTDCRLTYNFARTVTGTAAIKTVALSCAANGWQLESVGAS